MKHTFSNAQCAHVWASQSQDYGRGSSLSFNGKTITSYSTNMATFIRPNVVFVNVQHYSHTTSKHQCDIRRALSDTLEIFEVSNDAALNDRPDTLKNIRAYYVDTLNGLAGQFTRARLNKEYKLREWRKYRAMLEAFCRIFCYKLPKFINPDTPAGLAACKVANRKRADESRKCTAAYNRRKAELQAEIDAELPIKRNAWLAGLSSETSIYKHQDRIYLRADLFDHIMLRRKDNLIETSNGAEIPYKAGQMLFNRWRLSPSKLIGKHAGSFEIVESDAEHLRAGCTTITAEEINRFAKQENWL